ncbi:MAG: hypothetical protein JW759_05945 [Candidatus Coatesbacteria bacterium]|nr:hypothetical protein [Candidatus Coatesbacteria bacterium]
MSRFLTIVVCIAALTMMGGAALADETDWGAHEPYISTGGDHEGTWRWCVDPGDHTDNSTRPEGYGANSAGERGLNYAYAWGDGFEDAWLYYNWDTKDWEVGATGSSTGFYALQIDADIELFLNQAMARNLIYFHRLDYAESMEVAWDYWIESNNGEWVVLVFDDSYWGGLNASHEPYLDQVNSRPAPYDWGDTPPPAKRYYDTAVNCPGMGAAYYIDNTAKGGTASDVVLPIEFYMQAVEGGTAGVGTWVKGEYAAGVSDRNLTGIAFDQEQTGVLMYPGKQETQLKAKIKPHKYQPDGRYVINPTVEVGPQL